MDTITITLNGLVVSGHPGMTILELARESGVRIPTLCHDPHLAPVGACRICLVEDESTGRLVASCVTPISRGMVINTESPRVQSRRKTLVKLMLASHPDSCLVCDKGNRCELRKLAADMGIGMVDLQRIPQVGRIQEVNPFIQRDLSKCILCAKCIRADQEMVVEGAIDYMNRGFTARPAALNDAPLEGSECTFCGTCVAMCPTGALSEKASFYRGSTTKAVETVCGLCGCGCGVSMEVKDNRVVRVRPSGDGVGSGTLCVRGSYGYDFIHSKDRITRPMARVDGVFQPVSWDEALGRVAEGLSQTKEKHGPSALAVLASSQCTNEENYLLQRFSRAVLGTNNIDNGGRLYNSATLAGLGRSLGFPGTTAPLSGLEQSQVILVVGADPSNSAPLVSYAIKRAVKYKGAQLVLIDPRETKLSRFATLWLRPEVGTDLPLINAMAKVIIDEDLLDEEHVSRRTDNFEDLSAELGHYTPEHAETITGVPARMIRRAARLFAVADIASIVYGNGITQREDGTATVMALANLVMLTGNIGATGGGIYALQRECNAQGAADMGALPDFLPGYSSIVDSQARDAFDQQWKTTVPVEPGLTALEMIQKAREGNIKGMYIVGENPALSFPDLASVRESLAGLEFLVVQDLFMTETAKLAHVVLPAASWAEKDGTFTNFEGRVQRVSKAIEPPGECMADWQIVLQLAKVMKSPMRYSSLHDVVEEIEKLVPLYSEMGYVESAAGGARTNGAVASRRLYKGHFPTGFGQFMPVHHVPRDGRSSDGYPLTLLTGTVLYGFVNGARSSRSHRLHSFAPRGYVELCPDDAERIGIGHGDRVKVISAKGELETLARRTKSLPQGVLFMPSCFPSEPVGNLFPTTLDPWSKTPSVKSCAVRLERIDANEGYERAKDSRPDTNP